MQPYHDTTSKKCFGVAALFRLSVVVTSQPKDFIVEFF
jgi:hypothetical protein